MHVSQRRASVIEVPSVWTGIQTSKGGGTRGVRIMGSVESGKFGVSPDSIISSCMILGLSYLTFFSLCVLICIIIIKLK